MGRLAYGGGDYTRAPSAPWQYHVQLPGLLGQPFPLWIRAQEHP